MSEQDREKTVFITHNGIYQIKASPFRLSGKPAMFQQIIDSVLKGTEAFAGVYLDDIVIYSKIWRDHLNHLKQVFQLLKDTYLTVKTNECVFAAEDSVYLGYLIGKGGTRPEDSRI